MTAGFGRDATGNIVMAAPEGNEFCLDRSPSGAVVSA